MQIMPLPHGGDIYTYEKTFGHAPLDFSANINPFGMPQGVKDAIVHSLAKASAYPDPLCRDLCAGIAQSEGVQTHAVLCGNGAADLIWRLVWAQKPQYAMVLAPTFCEYEQALGAVGCRVKRHILQEQDGFCLTNSILQALDEKLDILFLCNPNNPTGQLIQPDLLHKILQACLQKNILLVLDECFLCFCPQFSPYSAVHLLGQFPNLLILKAFTKLYAMAGVRLGYLLCQNKPLLQKIAAMGQPWGVSALAQAAGLAALKENEYVQQSLEYLQGQNLWLKQEFAKRRLQVIGSHANFLFFKSDDFTLDEMLKQQGVLIRSCRNYHGLGPQFYRIGLRLKPDNQRLLDALDNCRKESL